MLIIIQLIAVIFTSGAPFEQQFFGRTGRGLGFATEFSLIVILLAATLFIRAEKVAILQISLGWRQRGRQEQEGKSHA